MDKLKKVVIKAVRWIAAEYGYLEKLFLDLQLIEGEHGTSHKGYYKKARRLFRYVSRCEAKADKYVKAVIHQARNHPELVALAQKLEVAENELVRAFSLYSGEFRIELDDLLKYLRYKKYFNKGAGVQDSRDQLEVLVKKMEQQVETLLTWTEGLQVSLLEFEKSFTDLSRRDFTKRAAVGVGLATVVPGVAINLISSEAEGSPLKIVSMLSSRNQARARRPSTSFIILHHTESNDNSGLNSVHKKGTANYVVSTNGTVYKTIDHDKISKHAGRSMYNGLTNISNYSVGIEIVGYHYNEMTPKQYVAVKELVRQLKSIYNLVDDKVLPHTAVAYQRPNKWNENSYRPRRMCGMLMATTAVREKLGLGPIPERDPDLDAKRLTPASDSAALNLYYTYVYPAYMGKKRHKKPTPPKQSRPEKEVEEIFFQEIGVDGDTAYSIARGEYASRSTIYFFPEGYVRMGDELPDKKQGLDVNSLPKGTRILVGYKYGGKITQTKSIGKIAGKSWNYPSTFYYEPSKRKVTAGDEIDPGKVSKETIIVSRN